MQLVGVQINYFPFKFFFKKNKIFGMLKVPSLHVFSFPEATQKIEGNQKNRKKIKSNKTMNCVMEMAPQHFFIFFRNFYNSKK